MTEPAQLLLAEHRAILAAADRLATALRRSPRVGLDELGRSRAELAGLLQRHAKSEQALLLGPIAALPIEARPTSANAAERAMRAMRGSYSEHVRDWHGRSIAADWAGYVTATLRLIRDLHALVRLEERDLHRPGFAALEAFRRAT